MKYKNGKTAKTIALFMRTKSISHLVMASKAIGLLILVLSTAAFYAGALLVMVALALGRLSLSGSVSQTPLQGRIPSWKPRYYIPILIIHDKFYIR